MLIQQEIEKGVLADAFPTLTGWLNRAKKVKQGEALLATRGGRAKDEILHGKERAAKNSEATAAQKAERNRNHLGSESKRVSAAAWESSADADPEFGSLADHQKARDMHSAAKELAQQHLMSHWPHLGDRASRFLVSSGRADRGDDSSKYGVMQTPVEKEAFASMKEHEVALRHHDDFVQNSLKTASPSQLAGYYGRMADNATESLGNKDESPDEVRYAPAYPEARVASSGTHEGGYTGYDNERENQKEKDALDGVTNFAGSDSRASELHKMAAKYHTLSGDKERASHHQAMAEYHTPTSEATQPLPAAPTPMPTGLSPKAPSASTFNASEGVVSDPTGPAKRVMGPAQSVIEKSVFNEMLRAALVVKK